MKISVKVKPNMKEEKVEREGDVFTVSVKEPAKEGRANKAVIALLSEFFNVPKSRITILMGMRSKQKIVEIKDHPILSFSSAPLSVFTERPQAVERIANIAIDTKSKLRHDRTIAVLKTFSTNLPT
ncbi:MAG: DUF167 domain-containing protein [Nitrospira sp.]|nr:DUF167 domain-containing protein [Nitrospira sp.]